ncbi:MAG: aspartyl protease family protein [Isosphaeraceae bacterium]
MPILTGVIRPWGPVVDVKIMQTVQRVEALKKANRSFGQPVVVAGLIDTGASCSALDTHIIERLGLEPHGVTPIHTPSTGPAYELRHVYDASIVLGETENPALIVTVGAIACDLAAEGYFALIGRDVLSHCRLIYDGPQQRFNLEYEAP